MKKEMIKMIITMRQEGVAYQDIADTVGVSIGTVGHHCRKRGLGGGKKYRRYVEEVPPEPVPADKYAHISERKINPGKNYQEYLDEQGIVIPKVTWSEEDRK
jgi:hypothetical protein